MYSIYLFLFIYSAIPPYSLQKLVSVCDEYCGCHSITFHIMKSVCMFFKCTVNKHCDNSTLFLSENHISFVQEVKYLGVY